MPESKRMFLEGRMETSVDPRLVPPGTTRNAENVNISRTEGASIGALENLEGNNDFADGINFSNNYYTLGSVKDELNDKMYWFFKGPGTEGIYEFDISIDTRRFINPDDDALNPNLGNPMNKFSRILEFNTDRRIFNFQVDYLITGANVVGGLLYWTDGLNPPRKINIDRFRGAGNYYLPNTNGDYIIPSQANPANGNPASMRALPGAEDARLLSDANPSYEADGTPISGFIDTIGEGVERSPEFTGDLINVGKRPPLNPPLVTEITTTDPLEQPIIERGDYLYDNFVYFAYRYKYTDGETTALSPFSRAVFQPRSLDDASVVNRTTLEVMANTIAGVEITYDTGNAEVTEVELIVTSSRNLNLYSIVTRNKADLGLESSTSAVPVMDTFPFTDNKVYRTLPSDEITRIFDGVPLSAKAQEFVGNRLVYGNYVQNYELIDRDNNIIVPDLNVAHRTYSKSSNELTPSRSVKSDRSYEVGIVYLDKEGRQTPVLVSENNTHNIPFDVAADRNILNVAISSPAPIWASHYRFFIKQTQGNYQTLIPTGTYRALLGTRIIVGISGSDINKVAYNTKFVIKRNGDAVVTEKKIFSVEPKSQSAISEEVDADDIQRERVTTFNNDFLISYEDARSFASNVPDTEEAKEDLYFILNPQNAADINDISVSPNAGGNPGFIFETIPTLDTVLDVYYEHGTTFLCANGYHTNISTGQDLSSSSFQRKNEDGTYETITVELPDYFNCFSYANGIEEIKVLGEFNETSLLKGVKASTVNAAYQQDDKKSFLIHSGIFNDNRNLNELNQFNTNQPIEKELDVSEGSIQYIHSRDTNLIVFQEDKILNVPINKNLIQSAGGNAQLTTSSQFFGTERSYAGEFGISTNPESFCTYGTRIFFADKNRGVLCQLAQDGITEISNYGMQSWVRDNIAKASTIIGQYDDYHKQALFTFRNTPQLATRNPNRQPIQISFEGSPDPRIECNKDTTSPLMIFQELTAFIQSGSGVTLGDVIYSTDPVTGGETLFDGNNRYYRVQLRNGANPSTDYNMLYQISEYGIVNGLVEDCSMLPPYITRQIFDISSECFNNKRDACADGRVRDKAYHDGANLLEPGVGSFIYDNINADVRSTRNGWYLITEGLEKSVIYVLNGVVSIKESCDSVSLGRRAILGSEIVNLPFGTPEARRNLDLCNESFAEQVYWFKHVEKLPPIGTIIWENNANQDITVGAYDAEEVYDKGKVVTFEISGTTRTYRSIDNNNVGNTPTAITDTNWTVITGDLFIQLAEGNFIQVAPATEAQATTYNVEVGQGIVVLTGICSEKLCFLSPADLFTRDTNYIEVTSNGAASGANQFRVTPVSSVSSSLIGRTFTNNELTHTVTSINATVGTLFFTPVLDAAITSGDTIRIAGVDRNPSDFYFLGVDGQDVRNAEIEYVIEGQRSYGPFLINAQEDIIVGGVVTGKRLYLAESLLDTNKTIIDESAIPLELKMEANALNILNLPIPSDIEVPGFSEDPPSELRFIITSVCYRSFTALGVTAAYISTAPITPATAVPDVGTDNSTNCNGTLDATGANINAQTVYYDPEVSPKQYFTDPELIPANAFSTAAGQYQVADTDGGTENLEGGGVIQRLETIAADGTVTGINTVHCIVPYKIKLGYTSGTTDADKQLACDYPMASEVFSDQSRANFNSTVQRATMLRVVDELGASLPAAPGSYTVGSASGPIRPLANGILGTTDDMACSMGYTATLNASTNPAIAETSIKYTGTATPDTNMDIGLNDVDYNITATLTPSSDYDLSGAMYQVDGGASVTGDSYSFIGKFGPSDESESVVFVAGSTTQSAGYRATLDVVNNVMGGTPSISYTGTDGSGLNYKTLTDNSATGSMSVNVSSGSKVFDGSWYIGGVLQNGNSGSYQFSYSKANPTSPLVSISGTLVDPPQVSTLNAVINVPANSEPFHEWGTGSTADSISGTVGTSINLSASATAAPGYEVDEAYSVESESFTFPSLANSPANATLTVTGSAKVKENATSNWLYGTETGVCSETTTTERYVSSTTLNLSTKILSSSTTTNQYIGTLYIRESESASSVFKWEATTASNGRMTQAMTCQTKEPRTSSSLNTSTTNCSDTISTGQTFYVEPPSTTVATINNITRVYASDDADSNDGYPTNVVFRNGSSRVNWTAATETISTGTCPTAPVVDPLIGGSLIGNGSTNHNGTITITGEDVNIEFRIDGANQIFPSSVSWDIDLTITRQDDVTDTRTLTLKGSTSGNSFSEEEMGNLTGGYVYDYTYKVNSISNNLSGSVSFILT